MGQFYAVEIKGNLRQLLLDRFDNKISPLISRAVDEAATFGQGDLRDQAREAGLGNGIAQGWQKIAPGKRGYRFSALVYSKARRLVAAFNQSFTITARAGRWLVIPLQAAIDSGWAIKGSTRSGTGAGAIPPKWSDVAAAEQALGRLRFVELPGDSSRALLFPPRIKGELKGQHNALFLLIKQSAHNRLLDLEGAAQRMSERLKDNLDKLDG